MGLSEYAHVEQTTVVEASNFHPGYHDPGRLPHLDAGHSRNLCEDRHAHLSAAVDVDHRDVLRHNDGPLRHNRHGAVLYSLRA